MKINRTIFHGKRICFANSGDLDLINEIKCSNLKDSNEN